MGSKLTPEIKSKINELINNPKSREMSLDDLEHVSGGKYSASAGKGYAPEDWRCPVFGNMTWPELGEFIDAIYSAFGHDVTVDFCMEYFHCYTNDWDKQLRAGGPYYCAMYMVSCAYG
jgi:hypothetical protein